MMVTFVSQCEKKALKKTRRVLDAFADRIGDNTWQTVITEEGLKTVQKMLRQTASKSTAVSCHWIRSRSRSQFIWVVGNKNKFDARGVVPVNYTEDNVNRFMDDKQWRTINVIQYAAAIVGLFHDLGKANNLFQNKLKPMAKGKKYEPYRHEWISLRLFQTFVGSKDDAQWIDALVQGEFDSFSRCFRDGLEGRNFIEHHPIANLSPFAKLVAWLILTHHKLPVYTGKKSPPELKYADQWFKKNFDPSWNSHNCKDEDLQEMLAQNWEFSEGLPNNSMQWRAKTCMIASEAATKLNLLQQQNTNWLEDQLFTTHLARLCLMLADHYYSSLEEITPEWRNPNYEAWANTNRNTKQLKQKLDEHLIGVSFHAQKIAKALPKFNATLPQLAENSFLTSRVSKEYEDEFGWQDKARTLANKLSKASVEHGFFGINMASTGKGKTLANAKIMYALGSETGRRRFSVALGLRTLTLQTGKEYREQLELSDEELAIAVGGIAVKQLFENEQNQDNTAQAQNNQHQEITGSESQHELLDHELYVDYKGDFHDHSLSEWTRKNDRLEGLIYTPVLVSTIDHLMPVTEGTKGGRQIAPMLRLLSSELVLDEPDDFGLNDLPALCRLIHWAGLLGSRVLLSTATMSPVVAYALFQAYQTGWGEYAKANIDAWNGEICCAWFDEYDTESWQHKLFNSFQLSHEKFVRRRIKKLKNHTQAKRKGCIVPVDIEETGSADKAMAAVRAMASAIRQNLLTQHQNHHQSHGEKHISIGLVRMANINPLVAVAKEVMRLEAPQNTCIHYCVYHSRYPLAIRSYLENKLDKILKRKEPESIWQHVDISEVLKKYPVSDHIFVVLASPVAEVGRDHDYDWAIVEPSSMRSIIQLAGRVLRHRDQEPEGPNIVLLNNNYNSLIKKEICFEKPGFESVELKLASQNLEKILKEDQYQQIDAVQRITLPGHYLKDDKGRYVNLVELEHKALAENLFFGKESAKVWWKNRPHWCGEVQRQQRFRRSAPDEAYYLLLSDDCRPRWKWKNEHVYPAKFGEGVIRIHQSSNIEHGAGSYFWFNLEAEHIYSELAKDFNIDLAKVSRRFGEVRLVEYKNQQQEYDYHPNLGLYKKMGDAYE